MTSDWPAYKLDDLTDGTTITYGVVKPGEHSSDGVAFVRGGDVVGGRVLVDQLRTITREVSDQYSRTLLQGGELLVSLVGNPGEVAIVPASLRGANIARQVGLIRIDEKKADKNYIQFFLRSKIGRDLLLAYSKGSVQQVINLNDLKRVRIPLPPRNMQESIAQFLQLLDDRITLLHETNAALEGIAQALFKSWFVDFDPVRAKQEGRCPEAMNEEMAAMFPDGFEESELGAIPTRWEVGRVDDLLELAYGKALKASERTPGAVPVYGSGGITGHHNQAFVNTPSVIIGRKGTVGSLYWEDRPFFPIDTVFYVKTGKPLTYCFYQLARLGLEGMNTDGAVPGLNRNNVYRLPIVLPPDEILAAFDSIAATLRKRIFVNIEQVSCLATLRDTLLPRLISAQFRLPEAVDLMNHAA